MVMLYDLSNQFHDAVSVLRYTVSAMRDSGFTEDDIQSYLLQATNNEGKYLFDVSIDYVDRCNKKKGLL